MSLRDNILRPGFLFVVICSLSCFLPEPRAQPALGQFSEDSLVNTFVVESGKLSRDSLRVLLGSYVDHLDSRKPAAHAAIGELYLHYAKTFHATTGLDSIARYLDLAGNEITQAEHPCRAFLLWSYEAGRYAYDKNDYELSLTRLLNGLEYLKTHFPDDIRQELQFRNGIGIGYRRTGQPEKAVQCFREGIRRMEEKDLMILTKGNFYNNMGLAYMDMGSYREAIKEIRRALSFYKSQISPEYLEIGTGYDNLGICYERLGIIDSAKYYYSVSLSFIENVLGRQHPDLLSPLASLTELLMSRRELSEAGVYHSRAINLLRNLGWTEDDPSGNFLLDEAFRNLANGIHLNHLLYAGNGDLKHLEEAEKFIDGFINTTDYAFDQFSNSLSRQIFLEEFKDVFVEAVDLLFTMYNRTDVFNALEKAFHISEKYKSLELLHAARKSSVNDNPGYAALDREYRQFLDSIAFYEQILYEKSNDADIEVKRLENHINQLKETLYSWKGKVEDNYPEYYRLIYEARAPSMSEIREICRANEQAILAYMLGKDAVYSFLISSDTVLFTKSEVSGSPAMFIMDFRQALTGFHTEHHYSDEMYSKYLSRIGRLGTYLYKLLIYPVENVLPSRVTIIVDQELALLPFDALIKNSPLRPGRFRQYDFLLRHYTIGYGYSVSLWMEMVKKQAVLTNRLLALAPTFPAGVQQGNSKDGIIDIREKFSDLKYNRDEVAGIGRIFRSRVLTGEEATKDAFLALGTDFGLLHFATHSVVDPENGEQTYLAFYPGDDNSLLYAREMYSLPLRADMVTLSACETGVGEIRAGEGVISLARAFSFAGARSIVNSLWSVNDMSTAMIMEHFYTNLKNGLPKDLALQQARIEYIESQPHTEAHPFFWAGFIPAGSMDPVYARGAIPRWALIAGLSILLVLMIYFTIKFLPR